MRASSVLACVACSACLFPDLSTLSNDAGASDVRVDSPITDASADAGTFCSTSTHVFCADFDEGNVALGWDLNQTTVDGTLALNTLLFASSPASAGFTMARRPSSAATEDQILTKVKTGSFAHVVLDFDAYLAPPDWQTGDINAGILSVAFYSGGLNASSTLAIGNGYTTFGDPGQPVNGGPFPTNQWVHVHFDVDPAGTFHGAVGAATVDQTFSALTPGTSPETNVSVGIEAFNQPTPEYDLEIDNVTMDW